MENTLDSILASFETMARERNAIDPHTYLTGCEKINALLQGEQEILYDEEQIIAKMRKEILDQGKSVAYAKTVVEASDEYKSARKRKAKIERAIETIRLGKKHATLSSELMRNQM